MSFHRIVLFPSFPIRLSKMQKNYFLFIFKERSNKTRSYINIVLQMPEAESYLKVAYSLNILDVVIWKFYTFHFIDLPKSGIDQKVSEKMFHTFFVTWYFCYIKCNIYTSICWIFPIVIIDLFMYCWDRNWEPKINNVLMRKL